MEEKTQKIIVKEERTGRILGELPIELKGLWGITPNNYNVIHSSKIWLELVLKRLRSCDENYNINCKNCTNCRGCISCEDCTDCIDCLRCSNCENCTNCTVCSDCCNCNRCHECTDRKDWEHSRPKVNTPITNLSKAYDVPKTSIFD